MRKVFFLANEGRYFRDLASVYQRFAQSHGFETTKNTPKADLEIEEWYHINKMLINETDIVYVLNIKGELRPEVKDLIEYANSIGKEVMYSKNPAKVEIIDLVGPLCERNQIADLATEMTNDGKIVLTPSFMAFTDDEWATLALDTIGEMTNIARKKIEICDTVFFVDTEDGVYDENQPELEYAFLHNKRVSFLNNRRIYEEKRWFDGMARDVEADFRTPPSPKHDGVDQPTEEGC